jgi:hypothetical protein
MVSMNANGVDGCLDCRDEYSMVLRGAAVSGISMMALLALLAASGLDSLDGLIV